MWMGGKENGELLILADPAFDVFLTLDKNAPYQQNLASRRIGILIIRARSSRMQDLAPLRTHCDQTRRGSSARQLNRPYSH